MRKRGWYTFSNFHCQECAAVTPLPRYKYYEKGHIKHLWCYRCKETTKHVEERYTDWRMPNG